MAEAQPVAEVAAKIMETAKEGMCNNLEWGAAENAPSLGDAGATLLILFCCAVGTAFAAFSYWMLSKISIEPTDSFRRFGPGGGEEEHTEETYAKIYQITNAISEGAGSFLKAEYFYMGIFVAGFSLVILVLLGLPNGDWDEAIFSTLAFILGAGTSVISGYIGMKVAVYSNGRTCLMASDRDESVGYANGFSTAFRGGIVMGFGLSTVGMFMLFVGIVLFKMIYFHSSDSMSGFEAARKLMGSIAAYGLGGSSIAMFGRVGGGIFTKAADVGADLVGKVEQDIPEDDPRNPGVIADCIGDNVGDIAGMGSDLFGSFAEASCATLVISANNACLSGSWAAMMYPLLLSGMGIVVCAITTFFATNIAPAKSEKSIEPTLKRQLLLSCVFMTLVSYLISVWSLPATFSMIFMNGNPYIVKNWYAFVCVAAGLWSGLGIGYITEYYTSNQYTPVREVAVSCKTGAATNVIYGLALGYKSVIIPTLLLASTIYVSYNLASVFGIALGALGILSTMSIGLTIDAYGPISDNAGGIAEMSEMASYVRERTDALDAAGNTTAAIGKGYAIGSAALVGLALYGAFLVRSFTDESDPKGVSVNVVDPRVYFGLLIGAMIPYWFSAMTMKSVGIAALSMVEEIRRQFRENPGMMDGSVKPDYKTCVKIATDASLKEMIPPGALVVLSPIVFGLLFGPEALAGLLPGSLVSGVQMAISASNTGGAWDNAKKYVESGNMGEGQGKGSELHKAAVIGDTVGDPLKDTSGPALNIVVKLMAIISVVFAPSFKTGGKFSGVIFDDLFQPWAERDTTRVAQI